MRIVRISPQAEQIEEFMRRWEAFFPTRYKQMPGFRHANVGYDRATSAMVAISVWDATPGEAAWAEIVAEFRPQVADISTGPPAFEEYEVLTEV